MLSLFLETSLGSVWIVTIVLHMGGAAKQAHIPAVMHVLILSYSHAPRVTTVHQASSAVRFGSCCLPFLIAATNMIALTV